MKELAPANVNLKTLLETETIATEAILLIVSPGTDPTQDLLELAGATIGAKNYHEVINKYMYYVISFAHERASGYYYVCCRLPWVKVRQK